ncbi:HEAT repeat domain-containing protein [Paenibacillus sp. sgz302251]|uniref:HEAT repeat domain-containing protein n=1 Tax=Paenibacillus sp. sgz302251 TaxID=3414493 RepID=UPI003C7C40A3
MSDLIICLKNEVDMFKKWADESPGEHGEWETEYPHWDRLYSAVDQVLAHESIDEWNSDVFESILYTLARDNECENVLQSLIEHPNALIPLAYKAISWDDYEARWQVAFGLGEIANVDNDEVQALLERFLNDEHEYVRRRALFALEKRNNEGQ